LADFGLSRSFAPQDHSQTDGPTARTPKYCAPEVYNYEYRGRSADVFSLGCVFVEILSALAGKYAYEFADFRRGENGHDESFRNNLGEVNIWTLHHIKPLIVTLNCSEELLEIILQMTEYEPAKRPSASHLVSFFQRLSPYDGFRARDCCSSGPEPYIAAYQ